MSLTAVADWRRQPGRPRIMWLSTVQQDLKQHHLTLHEAGDLAQNRPLWRMMSTYGSTQSWRRAVRYRWRTAVEHIYEATQCKMLRLTTNHGSELDPEWQRREVYSSQCIGRLHRP